MSNIDDKLNEVLNIAEEVLDKKEEKNPLEIVNENLYLQLHHKLMLIQTLILVEVNFTSY